MRCGFDGAQTTSAEASRVPASRSQSVATADRDIQMYMVRVAGTLGDLLGDALVGVYVHGALAAGEYVRDKSIIEVIVVVANDVPPTGRENINAIIARLAQSRPITTDVSITIVEEHSARHTRDDLHWQLRRQGVRLYGPPADRLFGVVP